MEDREEPGRSRRPPARLRGESEAVAGNGVQPEDDSPSVSRSEALEAELAALEAMMGEEAGLEGVDRSASDEAGNEEL